MTHRASKVLLEDPSGLWTGMSPLPTWDFLSPVNLCHWPDRVLLRLLTLSLFLKVSWRAEAGAGLQHRQVPEEGPRSIYSIKHTLGIRGLPDAVLQPDTKGRHIPKETSSSAKAKQKRSRNHLAFNPPEQSTQRPYSHLLNQITALQLLNIY